MSLLQALRRPKLWLALLVAYWLTLFVATHIPGNSSPDIGRLDKVIHFGAFAVLSALACIALSMRVGPLAPTTLCAVVLTLAIYGGLDELLQDFVGRNCNIYDWLADIAGAATGAVAFGVVLNRFVGRRRVVSPAS